MLKYDFECTVETIRGHLMETFAIEVSNQTIWKARKLARDTLHGSHASSFKKLRCYAHMILLKNPGSVATVCSEIVGGRNGNPDGLESRNLVPVFKRIFICYEGARNGFLEGCRPFIGLDGCHLKGPFKGILMSVVALDGNMQFFPLAYGIVETENSETWKWFISQLKDTIGEYYNGQPWTTMSDRQKGLIDDVPLLPGAIHRYCAWHIWENFKKRFSGSQFKKLFWKASNTGNYNDFLYIMDQIKTINKDAYEWLTNIEAKHWSRSKFEHTTKCDRNTNNHTESFNGWLDGLRYCPPIQLLEGIRESHCQLLYTRHIISSRFNGQFPPKVLKLINENTRVSRHCIVRRCGEYEFQVEINEFKGGVRLDDKHCDCEMWQVSGIPCAHAISRINTILANVDDYVDGFFSIDKWRKCYSGIIHPIPSQNMWPPFENSELRPPVARPLPGRPKRRRRRSDFEDQPRASARSSTKRCKKCNEFGHNRRTCVQNEPVANTSINPEPVRGVGRAPRDAARRGRGPSVARRRRGQTTFVNPDVIDSSQPDMMVSQSTPDSLAH